MNIERTGAWSARAAKHAARADPLRLRVVDEVTLGDRSPSELRVALGMPSNLLAHHLGVLERAGPLTRTRSEHDRRRSHLRLAAGALDGLVPGSVQQARPVLFVCTGNAARSQLAAALWQQVSAIRSRRGRGRRCPPARAAVHRHHPGRP